MLSRNVLLTARHSQGSGGYFFHPNNDPNSTPEIRNAVSSQRIGNSDLFLVALDQNVGPNTEFYQFATESISATPFNEDVSLSDNVFNAGSFQNEVAYVFGRSSEPGPTQRDHAVGRNAVSGFIENAPFQDNLDNDVLVFNQDLPGDPDFVPFETFLQVGDSGAPVFVERNGELLLLGINVFVAQDEDGNNLSAITYTGNLSSEINAFISVNAVPEPSSAALVMIAGFAAFVRRRRTT